MMRQASGSMLIVTPIPMPVSWSGQLAGTITAELRRVAHGIRGEGIPILGASEVPGLAEKFVAEVGRTLDRASLGEVRDRIIAHDRDPAEIAGIHAACCGDGAAPSQNKRRDERCRSAQPRNAAFRWKHVLYSIRVFSGSYVTAPDPAQANLV